MQSNLPVVSGAGSLNTPLLGPANQVARPKSRRKSGKEAMARLRMDRACSTLVRCRFVCLAYSLMASVMSVSLWLKCARFITCDEQGRVLLPQWADDHYEEITCIDERCELANASHQLFLPRNKSGLHNCTTAQWDNSAHVKEALLITAIISSCIGLATLVVFFYCVCRSVSCKKAQSLPQQVPSDEGQPAELLIEVVGETKSEMPAQEEVVNEDPQAKEEPKQKIDNTTWRQNIMRAHAKFRMLCEAIRADKSTQVKLLLSQKSNPGLTDDFGRNALHVAVMGGHVSSLKALLLACQSDDEAVPQVIDAVDDFGMTALAIAVRRLQPKLVAGLVAAKADVNCLIRFGYAQPGAMLPAIYWASHCDDEGIDPEQGSAKKIFDALVGAGARKADPFWDAFFVPAAVTGAGATASAKL